jgi:hypothetical protein
MRSVIDISKDFDVLDELLAEVNLGVQVAEGEVTPELMAAMQALDLMKEQLHAEFEAKLDNLAAYLLTLKTYEAQAIELVEIYAKKAKRYEANRRWISDMVKGELVALGKTKVKTARFTVSVVGNGGVKPLDISQHLRDVPADAPPEYVNIVTTRALNTAKIREDLEAGKKLDFAELRDRGTRLAVK